MAGRCEKGAIPHDPSIVIPKLEDYIEVGAQRQGPGGAEWPGVEPLGIPPSGEVAAPVHLVEVDELGVGALDPAPARD